jgi:hypothetical protein
VGDVSLFEYLLRRNANVALLDRQHKSAVDRAGKVSYIYVYAYISISISVWIYISISVSICE